MASVIGDRIRSLRSEKNMTQMELATALHISNTTLSQYEGGQRIPSDEVKILMAAYFGVTVDYLLGISSERNKKNAPLTERQGEQIVQRALKDTGLLDKDGGLSEEGGKVISEFLRSNAEILKQLLDK